MKDKAIFISSISAWEVALLAAIKRLELTMDVTDWIGKTEQLPFVHFVPVDNVIAIKSVALPELLHADPADRLIIATAASMGIPVVTKDDRILNPPREIHLAGKTDYADTECIGGAEGFFL